MPPGVSPRCFHLITLDLGSPHKSLFGWLGRNFSRGGNEIVFVGHYSVAFTVKNERNKIPLWVLFVAVQLLDFLWAPFVLLGIEKVRIVPGITATSPLDLYYMPYTHSLIGALVWSGLAFFIYKLMQCSRASNCAALNGGLAVFSHWVLDLIVHRPDLAVYDDTLKVGFGLWNHKGVEFA